MKYTKNILLCALSLSTVAAQAAPIDWSGRLGFDSHMIKNVRGTSDSCTVATGSQCHTDDNSVARFQTMLLKLNPNLIVNDSVTVKGELSTASLRGAQLASKTSNDSGSVFAQSSQGQSLNINQMYAVLTASTAKFKVGKFANNFGLGAVVNAGEGHWDRYASTYDGIEAELKLGHFVFKPIWAKINTDSTGTYGRPSGKYDTLETGISAIYDNPHKEMQAGIYYATRTSELNSESFNTQSTPVLASQKVNIIDVFYTQKFGNFDFSFEVPMLSGEIGTAYTGATQDIDTNAYIVELAYNMNESSKFGIDFGMVKGDKGSTAGKFEGMYLHPNFQKGTLLYRYNYEGFQKDDQNIFASSIVNSQYIKAYWNYKSNAWTWKLDFMMAQAMEVAKTGEAFYDHSRKGTATASEDQEADLGYELTASFDYEWNPNVFVSGFYSQHYMGDYYKFDNSSSSELSLADRGTYGLKLSVGF